ncbi:MAG: hypothetical protein ACREKL_01955 [Chthoniobacterales bacterium]
MAEGFPLESRAPPDTNSAPLNFLILIPTLAFIALHFVKIRPGHGGLKRALVVWIVLFVGTALVLSRFPEAPFYPQNEALGTVRKELEKLAKKPLKKGEVVLLIQGSSAVAACVKPGLLERLLRENNLPARVFLISESGSNHFERIEMFRQWLKQLTPAQAADLRAARVVLLREVLYSYDKNPLSGFVENAFGDRSIAYASPANAWPMMVTAWRRLHASDPDDAPPPEILPLIASQLLFNVFRVGTIHAVEVFRGEYSNRGPGVSRGTTAIPAVTMPAASAAPAAPQPEGFDYAAAMAEVRASKIKGRTDKWDFPWQEIHNREILELAAGTVDDFAYLVPPHLSATPRHYEEYRLGQLDEFLCIDGGADSALAQLEKSEYWRDRAHLTPEGGRVFTTWLAAQITAAWPEISGAAPHHSP